jgi:hypothetical protein
MNTTDFGRSIKDHLPNLNTDQLYEPFRQTLNPKIIERHAPLAPIAAKSSFVSKDYKILSPQEIQYIVRVYIFRKVILIFRKMLALNQLKISNRFVAKNL